MKKLRCCNPWQNLDYDVSRTPNKEWYCAADEDALNEETKYKGQPKKRRNRFSLTPCPVPWVGRWNSIEGPWLVILCVNPDSNYDTINDESNQVNNIVGTDKEYNDFINKNLRGEAGMSEHLFSKIVSSRESNIGQKTNYLIEKLYPLYEAIVQEPKKKYEIYALIDKGELPDKQTQDFFDHILMVELCPYHTNRASQVGKLFKKGKPIFPSTEFNISLVRYMIKQGVPVVVVAKQTSLLAHSLKLWSQALGNDINKCMV